MEGAYLEDHRGDGGAMGSAVSTIMWSSAIQSRPAEDLREVTAQEPLPSPLRKNQSAPTVTSDRIGFMLDEGLVDEQTVDDAADQVGESPAAGFGDAYQACAGAGYQKDEMKEEPENGKPNEEPTPGVKLDGTKVDDHGDHGHGPAPRNVDEMAAQLVAAVWRKPDEVDEAIVIDLRKRRAVTQAHYNALVANEPNYTQRGPSKALTDSANRAMLKDPTLYYGIEKYVKEHDLTSQDACRFHMITDDSAARTHRETWSTVFRVMMEEPVNKLQAEVDAYRIPVNAATGPHWYKWMIVRNYTCYILHSQLGLHRSLYIKSF